MEGQVHSAVAAQFTRGDLMSVEQFWFVALTAVALGVFIFCLGRMLSIITRRIACARNGASCGELRTKTPNSTSP